MTKLGPPAALATRLLEELRVDSPAGIDIVLLAQLCGATVIERPIHGSDARIIGRGERAYVTVDAGAPLGRRRFSAAHELGHWLYDRGRIADLALVAARCSDIGAASDRGRSARETRADKFAAELLMPTPFFHEATKGRTPTFESLGRVASLFHTSVKATAFRLVDIGCAPAVFVELNADLSRKFFRRPRGLERLWPRKAPKDGTLASQLSDDAPCRDGMVAASLWFEDHVARDYEVFESSRLLFDGRTQSLLSWGQDEEMLLHLH